jgi:hypothetical protein
VPDESSPLEPLPDVDFYRLSYEAAQHGRAPDASLDLLDAALSAMEHGQPMPEYVGLFLAESLRRLVVDRHDARDAFKVRKPAGRPRGMTLDRDVTLAAAMILQFRAVPPAPDKTAAATRVLDTIGVRWGLTGSASLEGQDSRDTIINAYDELEGLRALEDDALEQLSRQPPKGQGTEETL